MAIFIPGSRCVICQQPVAAGEEMLFPSFTGNQADPIYSFSDAVAHQRCFEESPQKDHVESVVKQLKQMQWHRFCVVCAREITDPDEYFPLMELTGDSENQLWRWNFTQFHRTCLPKWEHLRQVIQYMRDELSTGRWRGPVMERTLLQLEKAANDPIAVR